MDQITEFISPQVGKASGEDKRGSRKPLLPSPGLWRKPARVRQRVRGALISSALASPLVWLRGCSGQGITLPPEGLEGGLPPAPSCGGHIDNVEA